MQGICIPPDSREGSKGTTMRFQTVETNTRDASTNKARQIPGSVTYTYVCMWRITRTMNFSQDRSRLMGQWRSEKAKSVQ